MWLAAIRSGNALAGVAGAEGAGVVAVPGAGAFVGAAADCGFVAVAGVVPGAAAGFFSQPAASATAARVMDMRANEITVGSFEKTSREG
jgi:hypothetical protein